MLGAFPRRSEPLPTAPAMPRGNTSTRIRMIDAEQRAPVVGLRA